ncbi:MAG: PAS domain S-box protein [Candidatus Aminicenantes bacterium]|nr:PAS domain S-box protein [Candidatus Aminicenantes bacterium]
MLWQWSPYVIAEFAAAAGIVIMAIYFPWRDLNRRSSLIGVTLLLVCSLWMLAHAIEIGLPVPSYKSYLMGAQLIWGIIALTLWLLYIVHQIGPKKWLTKRVFVLLGIMPLMSILGVISNHFHHLIWIKPGLDSQNPYLPLQPTYGITYWICVVYIVVLIFTGSFLLIKNVVRPHYNRIGESAILLIAAVLPMLAALIEILGLSNSLKLSIGITPWVSLISTIMLVWTLPRFHLRNVIPFARDTVFERIEDCIIVLDKRDRVLDLNPAAERFVGHKISDVMGYSVKQILPQWPGQIGIADQTIASDKEIVLERGGEQRTFNMSVSVAADPDGHSTSKVVLLADITYRKKAEEERQQSAEQLLNALKATYRQDIRARGNPV